MEFTASINLMRFKGAQCLDVTLADGKKLSGIFIPAAYNDMVRNNKQSGAKEIVPYVNVRARVAKKGFVDACLRNHAGEDNYRVPSHTLDVSFSKDFRERAIASASKRIAAERAAANQPALSDADLLAEAKHAVYITLGTMTPVDAPEPGGYQATASATATPSAQQYMAPAQPAVPSSASEAPTLAEDDLPF